MRLSSEVPFNLSPSVILPVIATGLSDGKTRIVLTITVIFHFLISLQVFHCIRKVNLQSATLRQYSNENMLITDGAV